MAGLHHGLKGISTCQRFKKIIPAKGPKQCVCVRSISRKSKDLDGLGSREVMVVMKVEIVHGDGGGGGECDCECECQCVCECD